VIDIRVLRESPDEVRAALARRSTDYADSVDRLLALDHRRRLLLQDTERRKAERNRASEEVARRKRDGADGSRLIAELKLLSDSIKALDHQLRSVERDLRDQLLRLPNLPQADLPEGDASHNRVLRTWGERRVFDFDPRPHWDLGKDLGILDLPRGAKLAGSGFPLFRGLGARLVRALIDYMIDLHTSEHGYVEVAPPYLVTREVAEGTGNLPVFVDEMYVTTDGLFLIPTAEVPVTNMHRDEILAATDLPRGYVAYTPCFRREAGAAGKDTRGLIRVHQFDKVELVRFSRPDDSPAELEKLLTHAETVLQRLDIPYRVVVLATGDLGFASAKTYDLEVWAAGVGTWLEVSSASTFTDFQARRANIRYRPAPGEKPEFVHTLNASGVALPRTLIAILENYQQADGSLRVPEPLVPYLGKESLTPSGGA
jgi:seryl-tRNA synthetase